jgi:predicted dehydrogenase
MAAQERQIRYVVVGAGNIAQIAMMPAFAHAKSNSKLVGIVSGDPHKRAELRKRYDLEAAGAYDDLETILRENKVDAVYIATPNALHREYAERAAGCGVHVLCEKPLAPTVTDCLAMAAACTAHNVKLMVAYRLHFEEATLEAIEIARSGELGELRLFSSFFSHVVRPGDVRQNPELAGGAAYDMGVYCINAARNLFGAEPVSVSASVIRKNGVDDTTTVQMTFPGERLAQFAVSNSVAGVSSYRIGGDKGDLLVQPAFEYAEGNAHHTTIDGKTKNKSYGKRDQFAPELLYFSDCILNDIEPEPSAEEGICDVRVLEAIFESEKMRRAVSLPPFDRSRRPSRDQEIHRPPISKPDTVNAPSPSIR